MTTELKIKAKLKISSMDPDGSRCLVCGDSCYLSQSRISIYLSTGSILPMDKYTFCQSCKPELQ